MEHEGSGGEKPVLVRGLELLELALERSGFASMRELAKALNSQPSTVHRTLLILEKAGYLLRGVGGQIAAGPNLLRLAMLTVQNADPGGGVHAQLLKVAQETNETALLFLARYPDCAEVFVADIVTSSQPLQYRLSLGHSHATTAGASGLSVLAFLPDELADSVLRNPLTRYTDTTPVDTDAVRRKLTDIREWGFAITRGEHIPGAVGVAVPIFDGSNPGLPRVLGNVCLTVPAGRFNAGREEHYVRVLREAANALSVTFTTLRKHGHQLNNWAETQVSFLG